MSIEGDDMVRPFAVEALDVRGRVVRLGAAVDTILSRHAYPVPVARLLGEAIALTALLGTALKVDGRFILQTQSDGPVSMIVVDYSSPDALRAYARYDETALDNDARPGELLGTGHLAMTIDQGGSRNRYQGVVTLNGDSLEEAAHRYFDQSEQIPTVVRLAVAEVMGRGHAWRAGGLIAQFLPAASDRMPHRDLPGGDAPEGADPLAAPDDDDAWTEARSLIATIEDHELIDPEISADDLLFRLFHERGVRVFQPRGLAARCSCTEDRIRTMLERFSDEERRDMSVDDEIVVTCEFCSAEYRFAPDAFA